MFAGILCILMRVVLDSDPFPDPQAESTGNDQKSPESKFYLLSGDFGYTDSLHLFQKFITV